MRCKGYSQLSNTKCAAKNKGPHYIGAKKERVHMLIPTQFSQYKVVEDSVPAPELTHTGHHARTGVQHVQ